MYKVEIYDIYRFIFTFYFMCMSYIYKYNIIVSINNVNTIYQVKMQHIFSARFCTYEKGEVLKHNYNAYKAHN